MSYSYNRSTLSKNIYPSDFYDTPDLTVVDKKNVILDAVLFSAESGGAFDNSISKITRNKKEAYYVKDIGRKLLLRNLSTIVRKHYKISIKSRNKIVRELKQFLKESSSYRLYRLDINSFFESCDTESVIRKLSIEIPGKTSYIFESLIEEFNKIGGSGLPRGIESSSIISEMIMGGFDKEVKNEGCVYYYCRYVDDIIVITTGLEDEKEFKGKLEKSLPEGLKFNLGSDKFEIVDVVSKRKNDFSFNFSFIGYRFDVQQKGNERGDPRVVNIDISEKTQKKIKRKIAVSLVDYSRNQDISLLEDRMVFLSSNRKLRRNKGGEKNILSGIYYDYPMVDYPSKSLVSLDKFFKFHINSTKSRIYSGFINSNTIRDLSFYKSHRNRIFSTFSPNRIRIICEKWL